MHNQPFVVGKMQVCAVLTAELKTGGYAGASVTAVQDSKDSSLPCVPVLLEYISIFQMNQIGKFISSSKVFLLILLCFPYQGKTLL